MDGFAYPKRLTRFEDGVYRCFSTIFPGGCFWP